MDSKTLEYIKKIEKELEELGIKVRFEEGYIPQASGGNNVLNSAKVQKAAILTARLEGFKDALRMLELEE